MSMTPRQKRKLRRKTDAEKQKKLVQARNKKAMKAATKASPEPLSELICQYCADGYQWVTKGQYNEMANLGLHNICPKCASIASDAPSEDEARERNRRHQHQFHAQAATFDEGTCADCGLDPCQCVNCASCGRREPPEGGCLYCARGRNIQRQFAQVEGDPDWCPYHRVSETVEHCADFKIERDYIRSQARDYGFTTPAWDVVDPVLATFEYTITDANLVARSHEYNLEDLDER